MSRTQWWRWSGLFLTLCVLAGLEILNRLGLRLPNIPTLQLLVVYAAFSAGLGTGLLCAALAWLYSAYYLSTPGQLFSYAGDDAVRLVLQALVLPLTAVI